MILQILVPEWMIVRPGGEVLQTQNDYKLKASRAPYSHSYTTIKESAKFDDTAYRYLEQSLSVVH